MKWKPIRDVVTQMVDTNCEVPFVFDPLRQEPLAVYPKDNEKDKKDGTRPSNLLDLPSARSNSSSKDADLSNVYEVSRLNG